MQDFRRYAVYYAPKPGVLADFGAAWLGWDAQTGQALPAMAGNLAKAASVYGFHGTLKAPFRLAAGQNQQGLLDAMAQLCDTLAPVPLAGLKLSRLGDFLALVLVGDDRALAEMASRVVVELDRLRSPLTPTEMARRRPERLTPRQRGQLEDWGYPFVFKDFLFHMTLSDAVPEDQKTAFEHILAQGITPLLPCPFVVDDLCLFGQGDDGYFRLIARYPLLG